MLRRCWSPAASRRRRANLTSGSAAELGAAVAHAGPGLSVARNRALAEVGEEAVLAFLDDDAIPDPDWLERLAARWAEAIPTSPASRGDRPALAGATAGLGQRAVWGVVLSSSTRARPDRALASAARDVWGANVSFRAAPRARSAASTRARPWPGVPMFGDESDAEVRLEAAGKRILYAGDVRVEHLIDPSASPWPSCRGASAGAASPRLFRQASSRERPPRALKAAAGVATAARPDDAPLTGERRARLARELGVASAPLLRRRLRKTGWPGERPARVARGDRRMADQRGRPHRGARARGCREQVRRVELGRFERLRHPWSTGSLLVAAASRRALTRALRGASPEAVIAVNSTAAMLFPSAACDAGASRGNPHRLPGIRAIPR